VIFTIAGLGSKYRLLLGVAVKLVEPRRFVKRAWQALLYAVGTKLEDGSIAELLG